MVSLPLRDDDSGDLILLFEDSGYERGVRVRQFDSESVLLETQDVKTLRDWCDAWLKEKEASNATP